MHKEQSRQYFASAIACLGPDAMTWDLPEDHVTPMYEQYAENEDVQEAMADDHLKSLRRHLRWETCISINN